MTSTNCPNCAATMKPIIVGELHDKFLKCDHCGTMIDVPDSVHIEESEELIEETSESGQRRTQRKQRSISRSDSSQSFAEAQQAAEAMQLEGSSLAEMLEGARSQMGDEAADQLSQALAGLELGDVLSGSHTNPSASGTHIENISFDSIQIDSQTNRQDQSPAFAILVFVFLIAVGVMLFIVLRTL